MSTRRARIKGITALPPRRKNADNNDGKNSKDSLEKLTKSPRTPRSVEKNQDDKALITRPPPALIPIRGSSPKTPKPSIPDKVPTPTENVPKTPKIAEKVPVITAVSKPVFASPQLKGSPDRRKILSPVGPSPKLLKSNAYKSTPPTKMTVTVQIDNDTQKGNKSENVPSEADNKSDVIEDYNVPSVPESVTEDTVMDGITPLQSTCSAPKPIDLLKNEIISENAEVLFDPIVPLPSPSKVRPKKLRPVPRLGPLRRNSIQGSASESEDESRRALLNSGAAPPAPPRQRHDSQASHSTLQSMPPREVNRIRNDSICSSVSQVAQPPLATSPTKEKHVSRSRRQEMSRRMTAMRRRHENVQRDKLTMYDLIFYNPTTNPIVPNADEIKAKEANEKEAAKTKEAEEEADDPPEANGAPVPQIKLGPNGEIVLDEQSLVIKQTDSKRKLSAVVHEGSWSGSGGRYTRAPRTGDWSEAETVRFYRALAAIGTDFMLMAPLFPNRNRRDLYLKFKKEERVNGHQVDKALRSVTRWDVARLHDEFTAERAEAAARAQREAERRDAARRQERQRLQAAKELNLRQSRATKTLEMSVMPEKSSEELGLVDQLVQKAMDVNKRPQREKKPTQPTEFATLTLLSGKRVYVEDNEADKTKQTKTPEATPPTPQTPQISTLALINNQMRQAKAGSIDMATLTKVDQLGLKTPLNANSISGVPSNIEAGSLVVLTVNDPNSPSKKMLQTYIAHGSGQLTPVALPPTFLNSVIGYMKKGTPKSNVSAGSSPLLTSPSSVASLDSRTSGTPSVIQLNPSPAKRQRHGSYTVTHL